MLNFQKFAHDIRSASCYSLHTLAFLGLPSTTTTSAMAPKVASYGTWNSPITSAVLVDNVSPCLNHTGRTNHLRFVQAAPVDSIFVDPVTSTVYHIEKRPSESGRDVIVKTEQGTDVVGKEFNCRTGVIEVCRSAHRCSR